MKQAKIKENRQSPRFGVLDIVIILLVLVSLVGIYFRSNIVEFISSARNLESYSVG